MKTNFSLLRLLLAIAILLAIINVGYAGDLTYTTLPQASDTALQISNKAAVAASSNKYKNITTAATTVVKSGSGILERIIVNSGGSGSTIAIYDNTSAATTLIGTATSASQATLIYGCRFSTGLTIVTASGTAADITVVYR